MSKLPMVVSLLFILAPIISAGQDAVHSFPDSPPVMLSGSSAVLLNMPPFGTIGDPICDASGNPFFNVGVEAAEFGPFLKIQQDGSAHTVFDMPYEERDWGSIQWAVSPEGTFYVLHGSAKKRRYQLIRYRADGRVADISSVDILWETTLQHMAISDAGVLYVDGEKRGKQSNDKFRPGYRALFSRSGHLIKDLSAIAAPVQQTSDHSPEGGVAAGVDGRFYVVGGTTIDIINQVGDVERQLELRRPTKTSFPARIDYSSGAISIVFEIERKPTTPNQAVTLESRTIVTDTHSGEILGNYTFSPKLTGTVLCFNRNMGYTMFAANPSAIVTVPLR